MAERTFILQSSPHFRDKDSVPKIMYTVLLSLAPAFAASLYFFRFRAVALLLSCVISCLVTEALFLKLRKNLSILSRMGRRSSPAFSWQ